MNIKKDIIVVPVRPLPWLQWTATTLFLFSTLFDTYFLNIRTFRERSQKGLKVAVKDDLSTHIKGHYY